LGLQERCDVPELVSDRRSIDTPERTADVQSPLVLQDLHAASADGSVNALIDPRPRHRWHLRQINNLWSIAHNVTAMPVRRS
jgi:predicted carbohydrate-binding protein with CBM5 and CBM33 domain